jgi:transcriptional regulator with XRE-family HTH domain
MCTFGERLKLLRTEKELTQEQLAEKFGMKKSRISQYELNKRQADDDLKKLFADYFDVSLDYLLGQSDIRNPYENKIVTKDSLTKKDEKDISKDVEKIMSKLNKKEMGPTYYNGEEMKEDDKELFKAALELALKTIKVKNKETYTPKKYKK